MPIIEFNQFHDGDIDVSTINEALRWIEEGEGLSLPSNKFLIVLSPQDMRKFRGDGTVLSVIHGTQEYRIFGIPTMMDKNCAHSYIYYNEIDVIDHEVAMKHGFPNADSLKLYLRGFNIKKREPRKRQARQKPIDSSSIDTSCRMEEIGIIDKLENLVWDKKEADEQRAKLFDTFMPIQPITVGAKNPFSSISDVSYNRSLLNKKRSIVDEINRLERLMTEHPEHESIHVLETTIDVQRVIFFKDEFVVDKEIAMPFSNFNPTHCPIDYNNIFNQAMYDANSAINERISLEIFKLEEILKRINEDIEDNLPISHKIQAEYMKNNYYREF